MKIIDRFKDFLKEWKLSGAIYEAYDLPPDSIIIRGILIDYLNNMMAKSDPEIKEKLKLGFWHRAFDNGDGVVTFEHTDVNCQVVIAV